MTVTVQQQTLRSVWTTIPNVMMDIRQRVVMTINEIRIKAVEVAETIIREILISRQEATIRRAVALIHH